MASKLDGLNLRELARRAGVYPRYMAMGQWNPGRRRGKKKRRRR